LSRDIPEAWLSAIVIRTVLHIPVVMAEAARCKIASVVPPPEGAVKRLLVPAPSELLLMQPASPLANGVKNEGPALLVP
jgi:hypothetical protein